MSTLRKHIQRMMIRGLHYLSSTIIHVMQSAYGIAQYRCCADPDMRVQNPGRARMAASHGCTRKNSLIRGLLSRCQISEKVA
jgi:hypothetical protein